MYAQQRRRERRAAKLAEWKAANRLLIGVKAKPGNQAVLKLKKQNVDRVTKAIATETEYSKQINAEAAKYHIPDMPAGSVCLPHVALYAAGFRKARKGAVHFVK